MDSIADRFAMVQRTATDTTVTAKGSLRKSALKGPDFLSFSQVFGRMPLFRSNLPFTPVSSRTVGLTSVQRQNRLLRPFRRNPSHPRPSLGRGFEARDVRAVPGFPSFPAWLVSNLDWLISLAALIGLAWQQ